MRFRVLIVVLGLALALALAAWWGLRALESRRFQTELRRAQKDFSARRFGAAHARLARLAQSWPGTGEVEFWLGSCEMVKGHDEAALAAWSRVPDQAKEAPLAALSRGRLALETGRYRLAETALARASKAGAEIGVEGSRLLGKLYFMTGRRDEQHESKDRQWRARRCGTISVPLRRRSRAYGLRLGTRAPLADPGRHAAIQTISLHTGYGGRPDPFAK